MAAPDLDVRYVARLARLELSEEEITRFQAQLSDVLTYVEALRQVDVSGVEPTAHASAVFNVFPSRRGAAELPRRRGSRQCAEARQRPFRRDEGARLKRLTPGSVEALVPLL